MLRTFLKKLARWILWILAAIIFLIVAVLIVFRIASLVREKQDVHAEAPQDGYYIQAGDVPMYVQELGPKNGQPVVFIHGFGAWSRTWHITTEVLAAKGFHTFALDMPPFGFTEKQAGLDFSRTAQAKRILATLDSLHLKNVILVGHSVGGRPTIEAALLDPGQIKALVLVDAALGFGVDNQFEQNQPSWWLKTIFAIHPLRNSLLATTATNPMLTKYLLSTFVADPAILTPQLLSVYQEPLRSKNSTARLGDWLDFLVIEQDDSLSADFRNFEAFTAPVLVIWGDKDTITPLPQGQALSQLFPNASLTVLPGIGHIPQIENPNAFNAALLPFLETQTRK